MRHLAVSLCVALAALGVVGCAGTRAPTASHRTTRSSIGMPGNLAHGDHVCVDATRKANATDGAIEAGPFQRNQGYWSRPQGTKLWVASTRELPATVDATIRLTPVHDAGRSQTIVRPASTRAKVDSVPTFCPGLLRLPRPGYWRITVTIGPDTGCFLVLARSS